MTSSSGRRRPGLVSVNSMDFLFKNIFISVAKIRRYHQYLPIGREPGKIIWFSLSFEMFQVELRNVSRRDSQSFSQRFAEGPAEFRRVFHRGSRRFSMSFTNKITWRIIVHLFY